MRAQCLIRRKDQRFSSHISFRRKQTEPGRAQQNIFEKLDDFPPEEIERGTAYRAKEDLDQVLGLMEEFRDKVKELQDNFASVDGHHTIEWKSNMKQVVGKVLAHKKEVSKKIHKFSADLDRKRSRGRNGLEMHTRMLNFQSGYDSIVNEITARPMLSGREISSDIVKLKYLKIIMSEMTTWPTRPLLLSLSMMS